MPHGVHLHGQGPHADRNRHQDGDPVEAYPGGDRDAAEVDDLDASVDRAVNTDREPDRDEQCGGGATDGQRGGRRAGAVGQEQADDGEQERYAGQQRTPCGGRHHTTSTGWRGSTGASAAVASSGTSSTATLCRIRYSCITIARP